MYSVAVRRDFLAQHFLQGGDWGNENHPHSHHYILELILEGAELDEHGYLVDICEIESHLDTLIERYRDKLLNDFSEFEGLNPSIERFSRLLHERLSRQIAATNIVSITVKLWENDQAWAAYTETRK